MTVWKHLSDAWRGPGRGLCGFEVRLHLLNGGEELLEAGWPGVLPGPWGCLPAGMAGVVSAGRLAVSIAPILV